MRRNVSNRSNLAVQGGPAADLPAGKPTLGATLTIPGELMLLLGQGESVVLRHSPLAPATREVVVHLEELDLEGGRVDADLLEDGGLCLRELVELLV